MDLSKQNIKSKILSNKEILEKYEVSSIALFGSYARNTPRKNSDIDLLVEFSRPTYRNYIGLLEELSALFDKKIDLVCKNALKEKIKPYILEDAEWLNI
jgi:predicted nucleotidyltransferase